MTWLFFALIALFFGYLLFDAFGKPVGRTKPEPRQRREQGAGQGDKALDEPYEPYAYTGTQPDEALISLDEKQISPSADRALVNAGLNDIAEADERFEPQKFLKNATRTLELVLNAHQARDREQLQILLKDDLYAAFDAALTSAEEEGDNSRLELIGLGESRFADARMEGTLSVITLSARLEQLIAKRDPDGNDVEGLGETVIETNDYTFVRDVNDSKPNWYLRSIEEA